MDEGENVSTTTRKIFEKCINLESCYAFSATSDRFTNKHLDYTHLKNQLNSLHKETSELIYYFGTTIVHQMPEKLVHVNRTYLQLPIEPIPNEWQKQQAVPIAVKSVIFSDAFIRYFDYIEEYYSDKVLFVPVKTIEQGKYLLDYCNEYDYKAVFWSGSGGVKSTNNIKSLKINSYEDIKKNANEHKFSIIIATNISFKGIDIKAITDILLVIGTNASVVNQIIGRAYRATEDIRLWLLYNENDRYVDWYGHPEQLSTPIYDACNGARMKQIRNAQKYVLQDIDVNYPPNKQPTKQFSATEYEQELLKPQIIKDKTVEKMNSILDRISNKNKR